MIRLTEAMGRKILAGDDVGPDTLEIIRQQLDNPNYFEQDLVDRVVALIVQTNTKNSLNPQLLLALREALLKPSEWATVWANEKAIQNCRGCGKRLENNEVMTVHEGITYCFNCLYPTHIACTCGTGSARLLSADLKKIQKMRGNGDCRECGRHDEEAATQATAQAPARAITNQRTRTRDILDQQIRERPAFRPIEPVWVGNNDPGNAPAWDIETNGNQLPTGGPDETRRDRNRG